MSKQWDWVRSQTAVDQKTLGLVSAVLSEAERRIKETKPAATSRTDFEGGKRRAARIVRDMEDDIRQPWTGSRRNR